MSVYQNIYKPKMEALKKENLIENVFTDTSIYLEYQNIFQNTFNWTVPDYMFKKLPELIQFEHGMYAGFIDNNQFKIYPCFANGILQEDGRYSSYTIVAYNGKTWIKNREDIVIGTNTSNATSGRMLITYYIDKMSECLQTINRLIVQARLSNVFSCEDEQTVLSLTEAYNSAKKGEPIIAFLSDLKANINSYSLYDAKQIEILQIFEVYNKFRSELDNIIGFHNIDNFKRERLTVNETECNNDIVHFGILGDMINRRYEFVKECWKKFPEYVNEYNFFFEIERDVHTPKEKEINSVEDEIIVEDGDEDGNSNS